VVEPNGWNCQYFVHTYETVETKKTETSSPRDMPLLRLEAWQARERVQNMLKILGPGAEVVVSPDDLRPEVEATYEKMKDCPIYSPSRGGFEQRAMAQCLQTKKMQFAYFLLRRHLVSGAAQKNFDLVVRSRFDMMFNSRVDINPDQIDDETIVTIDRLNMPSDSMCDCFAVMRPVLETCDAYFNIYDTLAERASANRMRTNSLEHHFGLNLREHGLKKLVLPNPGNSLRLIREGEQM
jgi:hypothetical protein